MTDKPLTQINENPVGEPELSHNDETFEKMRPFLMQVALFVAVGLLGLIVASLLINNRYQQGSLPWQDFSTAQSEFAISGNADRLTQVADNHPGTAAAMWALQTAGDYQLRTGIQDLATDRELGFKKIEQAKQAFQRVIDSPDNAKTPKIQQGSTFAMAYACEALGEFDDAAKYYSQLVTEAEESHFAAASKRGLARATNPQFVAAYAKFKEFEELGDAPGPNVPVRPDIDFPEFEIPESDPTAGDDAAAEETAATDEKSSDAEAAKDEPKVEQPSTEVPADSADEAAAEETAAAADEAADAEEK